MLHCHQSQFYEWLPYNMGFPEQVPAGDEARRNWLRALTESRLRPRADRYRDLLVQTYGPKRGREVELIEAFEGCEYGSPLDEAQRQRLFGFLH
jgi:hypothetical protein